MHFHFLLISLLTMTVLCDHDILARKNLEVVEDADDVTVDSSISRKKTVRFSLN
jgi:hypothetical protein